MPKFLNRQEIYRLLQRELPEGVYPDGPAFAYYSTADMDSLADVAATGYGNLERIYENYWPQSADERITDWEITAFGFPLEASLTLAERRDRVITKLRAKKGITKGDMKDAVEAIIGTDKEVVVVEWNCANEEFGTWQLGVSNIGYNTYLGNYNMLLVTGEGACDINPADYGLSEEVWAGMQRQAYTYEIKIFEYVLSSAERTAIDIALTEGEPARSAHVISDNQNHILTSDFWGFEGDGDDFGLGDLNDPETGGFFKSL